jgi:6-phosphogluconolactonase
LINASRAVVFMVSGAEKSAMVHQILHGRDAPPLPAQLVKPSDGELCWMLDRAAAGELS